MQLKLAAVFVSVTFLCVGARPLDSAYLVDGGPIFHDCNSTTGLKVIGVTVDPPCTAPPCVLHKGANASIVINLTAEGDYNSLTNHVTGKVLGANVPFPLPEPDACKDGISCPVKNGQSCAEKVIVPIKKDYPSLQVDVTWKIEDDKGNTQACFEMLIKIQ